MKRCNRINYLHLVTRTGATAVSNASDITAAGPDARIDFLSPPLPASYCQRQIFIVNVSR